MQVLADMQHQCTASNEQTLKVILTDWNFPEGFLKTLDLTLYLQGFYLLLILRKMSLFFFQMGLHFD